MGLRRLLLIGLTVVGQEQAAVPAAPIRNAQDNVQPAPDPENHLPAPNPDAALPSPEQPAHQRYFYNNVPFYADSELARNEGIEILRWLTRADLSSHVAGPCIENTLEYAKQGKNLLTYSNNPNQKRSGAGFVYQDETTQNHVSVVNTGTKNNTTSTQLHEAQHLGNQNTFGNKFQPYNPNDIAQEQALLRARELDKSQLPASNLELNPDNLKKALQLIYQGPELRGWTDPAEIVAYIPQSAASFNKLTQVLAPNQIRFIMENNSIIDANTRRFPSMK